MPLAPVPEELVTQMLPDSILRVLVPVPLALLPTLILMALLVLMRLIAPLICHHHPHRFAGTGSQAHRRACRNRSPIH